MGTGVRTGRTAVCHRATRTRANHRHRSPHVRPGVDDGGCVRAGRSRAARTRARSGIHVERPRVSVFHGPEPERRCVEPGVAVSGISGRLVEQVVLLDNIPANVIHDGGRLRFGPDGLLYITTGDAANEPLAQDLASFAGKILRINTDGTTPRGNPFSSPILLVGHRNPQGLDWHPASGDLWASEHGANGNDEINVLDSGANYGWPRIEGDQTMTGMRGPITFYNPAIAPSGASFYRGRDSPSSRTTSSSAPCVAATCCVFGSIPPRRAESSVKSACSKASSDAFATWWWVPVATFILYQ